MTNSVWTSNSGLSEFSKLKGDKKTDVLIIGGGICGILCAYFLKLQGVSYILAEGSTICSGITKNTTAKITSQHGLIYNKLIKTMGKEKALMYLRANENAISKFRMLAKEIDCDFETKDAYAYSRTDRRIIEDEVNALNTLGFDAEFSETPALPFGTAGAVRFKNQAQFNPLKFLKEISKYLNIYEHTFIRDIAPNTAWFDGGKITARKIIAATHFPFINKHGSYFIKMYQRRSYVSALENAADVDGMYIDAAQDGMSFRNYNNLLLLGGGGHRTGKNGGGIEELRNFAKKYYPNANEKYAWATQDCMSLDGVPYIGKYSKNTPDLYTATGFNKWGMTSSMAAALILCDMVIGKENEFNPVFSPSRSIIKPQLFINGFESAKNLLTPTAKRCPHLGCALKWNKREHTWDCPCHGSRFEKDGRLIDNPATGDAKI